MSLVYEPWEPDQFCNYSRRWLRFSSFYCPIDKDDCDGCSYHEMKEPNTYFKQKFKAIMSVQFAYDVEE